MTNTYLPHVGGVARSVEGFSRYYRRYGHKVLIVAPEFPQTPVNEHGVIRIPAIQRFNGGDFSVVLPVPHFLGDKIKQFAPDIVHSHHPFLVGSAALRVASTYNVPLVFTHHTMYEQYTHYVPGDSLTLKRFAIKLATSYANMCDQVFAPSDSIAKILAVRQVHSSLVVVPTGVDLNTFTQGSGQGFREIMGIPDDAFLVGHVGRLAPEKNLQFLTQAVLAFMATEPKAHFLVVGKGNSEVMLKQAFAKLGLSARLHLAGCLDHPILSSTFQAMDVFVFSSHSETQGMVLTEAMALSVPVIALDAPGVREVVNQHNGRLLPAQASSDDFAAALRWFSGLHKDQQIQLAQGARATAQACSLEVCAKNALDNYQLLLGQGYIHRQRERQTWSDLRYLVKAEWDILRGITLAAAHAIGHKVSNKKA